MQGLSVRQEVRDRVKIYLDDKPVETVQLIVVRVANIGNEDILPKDFETPITLNFGESALILSVEISERKPLDLTAQISYDNSTIKIAPLLLNAKDFIKIKSLVSRPQETPNITARIAGVKQIEDFTEPQRVNILVVILLSLLLALGIALVIAKLWG